MTKKRFKGDIVGGFQFLFPLVCYTGCVFFVWKFWVKNLVKFLVKEDPLPQIAVCDGLIPGSLSNLMVDVGRKPLQPTSTGQTPPTTTTDPGKAETITTSPTCWKQLANHNRVWLYGLGGMALKRQERKNKRLRQRLNRCDPAMDPMRNVICFFNIRTCEPSWVIAQTKIICLNISIIIKKLSGIYTPSVAWRRLCSVYV